MITLKENQTNTITFQKEIDTPLVTSSYDESFVYNLVLIPTLQNDTGSASLSYTTSSNETNPRWTSLDFTISSISDYDTAKLKGLPGTTYDLEVYYGPVISGSALIWGQASDTFASVTDTWSTAIDRVFDYNAIKNGGTLKYSDRVFISGAVSPIQNEYISSNENATYTVYQG